MQLFAGEAYFSALVKSIRSAHSSVTLASMVFDAEPPADQLVQALLEARQRDVAVTVYLDIFTKIAFFDNIHVLQGYGEFQRAKAAIHKLENAGVAIVWLGNIGANPYKRRFHQKLAIIDDQIVFFGGGINLTGESFHFHDFMFRRHDKALVNTLDEQLRTIKKNGFIADTTHPLDATNTLLIDGGTPRSSIIYDHALQLAQEAKHITFVSQMAPSGKLSRMLRRKEVTYYLNSPFAMSPIGGASELPTQQKYRYPNSYTGKRYIHAKCLVFTMADGSHTVLAGSHNFNERGVDYGTKEIALLSKDETVIQQVEAFINTFA